MIQLSNDILQSECVMEWQIPFQVEEKDLEVVVHNSLKNSKQCQEAELVKPIKFWV